MFVEGFYFYFIFIFFNGCFLEVLLKPERTYVVL